MQLSGGDNPELGPRARRENNMIKSIIARTRIRNGITTYIVNYESGAKRELRSNDNWPMSAVLFFTAEDTIRTEDQIIGSGEYAVRREVFKKA